MVNSLADGLSKPSILESVNGQVIDFGVFTGSGNTSVISFAKTFTAAPNVKVWYTLGSVGVASSPVVSAIGTGTVTGSALGIKAVLGVN